MVEYIVRTDKPIRLDEVLHLHGIHNFSVRRLKKHGRLTDLDELYEHEKYNVEEALFDADEVLVDIQNAPVIIPSNKEGQNYGD